MDADPNASSGVAAPDPAATNGNAAPWHESIVTRGADGTESLADFATWRDRAPKPLADFITANMTAARAKTEGMVRVPTAESPPEEWEGVFKALGRPEKPEDYAFEKPEKLPDGVEWDDARVKQFAPVAHRLGLTPAQVKGLSEWQIQTVGESVASSRAAMAEQIQIEGEMLKKFFPGESGVSDAAMIAQAQAGKHGIPAAAFDPSKGEFWGPEAMKLVVAQAREIAKLRGEATVTGHTASKPIQGGYEWAGAVMNDPKHPDYARYRDPKEAKFQQEVNAAFATSPPGWMPPRN